MGYPELFAQRTFAEETERITAGAIGWRDSSEIRLEKLQSDGFLVINQPRLIERLAAPWSAALAHDEVMLELKLRGNHLDRTAVERALLRRQARQVQRLEEDDASWLGDEPLWLVAPHLPEWLQRMRRPVCFAPGCYWIDSQCRTFLWIAANELPLVDELIPFLTARSGQALDEFSRWVAPRQPRDWVMTMLKYLPMSPPTREQLLRRIRLDDHEPPEIQAREDQIFEALLEARPKRQQELVEKGHLEEARKALRRVLARRQLVPSADDNARIEACTDLVVLERWLDQAVTAVRVADALE